MCSKSQFSPHRVTETAAMAASGAVSPSERGGGARDDR